MENTESQFQNIEEFPATEEEWERQKAEGIAMGLQEWILLKDVPYMAATDIPVYGASMKEEMKYGIYREADYPEHANMPDELGDD